MRARRPARRGCPRVRRGPPGGVRAQRRRRGHSSSRPLAELPTARRQCARPGARPAGPVGPLRPAPGRTPASSPTTPSTMARRLGDPETLAAVLRYRYWAMDGPDEIDRQIAVAIEIRDLGEKIGDSEILLHGLKCELHARFELGDYEASRRVAADLGRPGRTDPATRVPAPGLHVGQPGGRNRRSVRRRRGSTRRRRPPSSSGPSIPSCTRSTVGLSLPWRWLQGRMEDLRPLLELGKTGRASLGEKALVAWVASEIGERAQAEAMLADLVPAEVAAGDRNFHWWFLMVGLAQTALNLGDRRVGRHALRPHRAVRRPQLSCRTGHVPGSRLPAAGESGAAARTRRHCRRATSSRP